MADTTLPVLHRVIGSTPGLADRVRDRARALGGLGSPDILVPHRISVRSDGTVIADVPMVDGQDIAELSRVRAPLDATECVWLGVRVARAVARLHASALIHGDISPSNVVVGPRGIVLVDTLAPLCEDENGTMGFRAPEVIAGAASFASDVYSLGRLLRWSASESALASVQAVTRTMVDPDANLRPVMEDVPALLRGVGTEQAIKPTAQLDIASHVRSQAGVRTSKIPSGRWWRARRWSLRLATAMGVVAAATAAFLLMLPDDEASVALPVAAAAEPAPVASGLAASGGATEGPGEAALRLTQERFDALATADASQLETLVVAGSGVAGTLATIGDDLREGNLRYDGLAVTLGDAAILSAGETTAEVSVTYEVSAHSVSRAGVREAIPGYVETAVLVLDRTPTGWKVSEVRPRA
ncbi:hypothetical protein [Demequina sediminicola]|uniref:hypothetical protein n=1 Tax=Demequina sediminicola TaxID=1095026 RepID=UPI000785D097|nr:hypothetical protein [Demequina sediminicola]